jgi:hypothetical protein
MHSLTRPRAYLMKVIPETGRAHYI